MRGCSLNMNVQTSVSAFLGGGGGGGGGGREWHKWRGGGF